MQEELRQRSEAPADGTALREGMSRGQSNDSFLPDVETGDATGEETQPARANIGTWQLRPKTDSIAKGGSLYSSSVLLM